MDLKIPAPEPVPAAKTNAHRYYSSGGNGYLIDGIESPFLTFIPGRTYRFTMSSSVMTSHPFRFYLDVDKNTAYTTDVTSTGTYTEIVVKDTTPSILHYQCSAHAKMGNAISIATNVANVAETVSDAAQTAITSVGTLTGLTVNGDITMSGTGATGAIKVASGTTAQRPTPAAGMFRYNTTDTKFEGYNGSDWGEIGGGGGGGGAAAGTHSLIETTLTTSTAIETFTNTSNHFRFYTNYEFDTNFSQYKITVHFTVYNELVNTNFEINLRLGGQAFSNSVSHRYRQTYKHFSSNQCMEYSKTFYLSRSDAGSSSANVTKNIDITFTSNTTDKYFLFTNAITSTSSPGNYTTTNVHYPSISIEPIT